MGEGVQDQAQEGPQPGEDETEIVSDGSNDDVSGVACATFEIAAAEMAVALQVPDNGLDGRAASELALDDAERAALLAGEEEAALLCGVVASSLLRGWRATPGTTAATSHFAWLISITAMIVLSCSREVRDLLASKSCDMGRSVSLLQSAKGALPPPPAP